MQHPIVPYELQDKLLSLVPLDPRGRIMFDFEEEDTRDELELMEAADDENDAKSEHEVCCIVAYT